MSNRVEIIDRGRGPQLSTSRVTVQDLVPYFQDGSTYEEIIRWIPSLTTEEIAVVECFYRQHKDDLDEQDRRIQRRTEEQVRLQRLRFPELEGTTEERLERLKKLLHQRRLESNGEGNHR
ncbi:MAG: DUF433 domain-containing protein [Planctomycetes bacterium]|nr:DUF433 domain-containing protein [Planctomycetota bacterium]